MNIIILTYAKDERSVATFDRLAEEGRTRGHQVQRVRYPECCLAVEQGVQKIFYREEELTGIDAVIPWAIQGDIGYGMGVLRHLEDMGVLVLNTADAFENANDKWRTAQLLARNRIPTPDTYHTESYKGVRICANRMGDDYQVIIKEIDGLQGRGAVLMREGDSINDLKLPAGRCVMQEFIQESAGKDIRAYVVGEQIVASMERRAEQGFRSNLHLGGKGSAVDLQEREAELVMSTMKALGLSVAGIDLLRSRRGPLVIEANASAGFGIESVTDVNVAARIIEYIELKAKRRNKKDKVGA